MSIIKDTNILTLKSPEAIFNASVETDKVLLNNFQVLHFLINSGKGTETKVNAKLIATNENGDKEETIFEDQITIGNNNSTKLTIVAEEVAHDDLDRVYLQIDNANQADIFGCILVIQENERYSI